MLLTNVYYKNCSAIANGKKVLVNYGGSSSSKTISGMQLIRTISENKKSKYSIFIGSSVPKLKRTLIKDFKSTVMGPDYNPKRYYKTDKIYEFKSGSIIEFVNADEPDKFVGIRTDNSLFDEINTFRYGKEIFDHIDIRAKGIIVPTFNPAAKFWITDVMAREDCQTIHSTYKDNEYCPKSIIKKLEQRSKTDENFYRVYVLGEWGSLEGLVFKFKTNWDYYTKEPKEYDAEYYGGDFGFSNDPTTAVRIRIDKKNKIAYVKLLLHQTGLLNSQIADILKPIIGTNYIIFDSAEPKSIVSLRNQYRLNALSAVKGADSIRSGIERMKEWKLLLHESDKEMIDEFFNYAYVDKEGLTNVPIDKYNHCIDAIRYVYLKYRL